MWRTADPRKLEVPALGQALPGRSQAIQVAPVHAANGAPTLPPWPGPHELAIVGMGCFWGAERVFWLTAGVISTQVGYAGGQTANPTYEEVCSGRTGHTEVVRVVFDPSRITYAEILRVFWERHNPAQGMRQGNDVGTQYRSALYTFGPKQAEIARASRAAYQSALSAAGHGAITTEVAAAPDFYYAEDYHQQYLHKNPNGYCGLGGTGVACPTGFGI